MRSILLPVAASLLLLGSAAQNTASAQAAASTRPYREGPVMSVSFIRTKPGMFDRYMEYLNGPYKANLEAQKAAGLILDYAIYTSSETRSPADHDIMLTTTYKNWAAFDGLSDKQDAVANRTLQSTVQQRSQQFADRGAMRESLGGRTYQQLVFTK